MSRKDSAALRAEARAQRRAPRAGADDQAQDDEQAPPQQQEQPGPEREARQRKLPPAARQGVAAGKLPEIAATARQVLRELRGVDAETVSGVTRTSQGWQVTLEVVELRRIPDSTDLLASYDVELDEKGGVLRFERGRRYSRSQAEGGGGR